MLALVNPGDRILIPEPTYSLYSDHGHDRRRGHLGTQPP